MLSSSAGKSPPSVSILTVTDEWPTHSLIAIGWAPRAMSSATSAMLSPLTLSSAWR